MVIATVSGTVISSIVLLFISIKYRSKMASLITWLVDKVLLGPKDNKETQEETVESKSNSVPEKSKAKGSKVRQRTRRQHEDPTFSTNLSTPIEDIIEESITEEYNTDSSKKKGKHKKKTGSSEGKELKKHNKKYSQDDIGYSFFPVKKIDVPRSEKNHKIKNISHEIEEKSLSDEVGFSFLPVKEKGKKYTKLTENKDSKDTFNTIIAEHTVPKTKEDLSRPSIIDHYKKRSGLITAAGRVSKKITNKSDVPQIFYDSSKLDIHLDTTNRAEYKETKKVTASISYASVVTNKLSGEFPSDKESLNDFEIVANLDTDNKEESGPTSIEILKGNKDVLCLEKTQETEEYIETNPESNSSSIEIINDTILDQYNAKFSDENLEQSFGECGLDYTQLGHIEDNSHSKDSSICILDTQTEFECIDDLPQNIQVEQSDIDPSDQIQQKGILQSINLLEDSYQRKSSTVNSTAPSISESLNEFIKFERQTEKNNRQESETGVSSVEFNLSQTQTTEEFQYNDINNIVTEGGFSSPQIHSSFSEEPFTGKHSDIFNFSEIVPETTNFVSQNYSEISEFNISQQPQSLGYNKIISQYSDSQLIVDGISQDQSVHAGPEPIDIDAPLQKLDYKSTTASFIEEEKFVQKFAYATFSSTHTNNSTKDKQLQLAKMQQIRVLTLNDQEHQECTLYRLEKNWIIQFRVGPSLFGRKVNLYCNYPSADNGKLNEFDRNKYQYQLLEWVWDEGCENADDTAAYSQIQVEHVGSFHYYFTYSNGENHDRQGSGYFLVDPILKYGNNEDLLLDCIQCQTVLSKCLGSFSSWEKKLQVTKESGYNMIHFTPIQELGESNSSYSLSEQLRVNPVFKKTNGELPTFEEIEQFVSKLRNEWKIVSICDIVLNHTANESKWIQVHPEVTYNCANCPYMRPAYLLDAALHQFSLDVKKGYYEDKGIPPELNTEEHLNAIRFHFSSSVLEPLNIPQLYICDVNKCIVEFLALARSVPPVTANSREMPEQLELIPDPDFKRLSASINMDLALKLYNVYWADTFDEDSRLKRCAEELKKKLESLNQAVIEEVNEHLKVAVENVIAGIRYYRVQADGPRFKEITTKTPLVYRYFTDHGSPKSLEEHEEIMYSDKGSFLMAHNGWVMNSDPLKNFAGPGTTVYIRRELIAWGDSVKLRYGDKPEDCPFLWDHMRKYVEQTASIFDGVRLDNCHSTPIPVAEYLLDCARRVRPNLYVVAELFTNSDMTDNIFVNRLGITSLIREAMSAWDSHEEGRLVYRYGGLPVGSFHQPSVRPLVPSIAHALFLDQTHDNPSPVEKRSVFDLLPSTALVNMACCASGSNRGYDELVPHHIHVVDEDREYTEWGDGESVGVVDGRSALIGAKRAINDLHFVLGKEGFNQVYVDQMDTDIVAVTRHCPDTHQSYILVAFTAFGHPNEDAGDYQRDIKPLRFEGVLEEIVLEATLSHKHNYSGGSKFQKWDEFVRDPKWINGLSDYQISIKEHIPVAESDAVEKVDSGTQNTTQLNFKNFKPGSIIVVKVSLPEPMRKAINTVRNLIDNFSLTRQTELSAIIKKLTLADLNRALYRCDQEERDEGFGFDTYNIPNFGSMVYAGFQGIMSLLSNIRPNNDLGHPMCANLRDGNWMIEYMWKRLNAEQGTKELGLWIEKNTLCFIDIPRYLVPCYFDAVVTGIYILLVEQCHKLMNSFVENGSTFVRSLALGSVQCGAYIKSANLPTLSPNLKEPKPPLRRNENGEDVQACITLSAGLPHFSVGYMRNWGRDTFIALRGLFILPGRYQEAREHILGYAACLRHGLIPNLLDGGRNSRFNCRDAVWWWLYCVKEYVGEAPNGIAILSDKVSRIFPDDDSSAQDPGVVDQPLCDVIQEALRVHFQGLIFRERNAGRQIDEHMTDQGFNNQIGIHPETGFVFGGNQWNCGTWMDKMGSSDKAGNRGKPATPRDGSAVELIGLSKSVISWLSELSAEQKYPYNCVERTHKNGTVTTWTFEEWNDKIQSNFEKCFWVNSQPTDGEVRPDLINKRGIYKDSYGASQDWTDFQLRCNFPIAMVAAPELFNPHHAWEALSHAEKYLLGPLGMKTLDPEDWAYRGDYDNSNDSNDPTIANGFNYHQGPEWVWPMGFFLRAKLIFAEQNGALKQTLASTKLILAKHFAELQTSAWRGLPELTNSNGACCHDSCKTQAWSMSCILEVLYDLQKIESSVNLSSD
ncbi:unnamed protein product [Phaedon cochleariae]|uniref:Glycogen debranching enzyme n=1 Tax=Phaedon cochleariae TaxID=80249 RepID=A0A9N9SEQ2_PHACE|nr:unnamed protein product [Phaedon cochleariae]